MTNTGKHIPEVNSKQPWPACMHEDHLWHTLSEKILPHYLITCRWYGGKARTIDDLTLQEVLTIPTTADTFFLLIINLLFNDGKSALYQLPIGFTQNPPETTHAVIAHCNTPAGAGYLIDAIYADAFRKALYANIINSSAITDGNARLAFEKSSKLSTASPQAHTTRVLNADQSNTAIIIDDKYFLKLYRKVDYELNPDLEITRFLTESTPFHHIPTYAGGFTLYTEGHPMMVLGMMQEMIPNKGDAWQQMLELLETMFLEMVHKNLIQNDPPPWSSQLHTSFQALPSLLQECIGEKTASHLYLLGQRSAEMHMALAMGTSEAFKPVPFDEAYRLSFFDTLEQLVQKRLRLVNKTYEDLSSSLQAEVAFFIDHRITILNYFRKIKTLKTDGLRTRIHGDFHLGQVLFTGDDYIILDFEGEPESTVSARKIKHSPLKDLAGMVRSFHYALYATVVFNEKFQSIKDQVSEAWRQSIYKAITGIYLHGYFTTLNHHPVLPGEEDNLRLLLDLHTLEKAVYELGYELNGRPDWAIIPLRGIQYIVQHIESTSNP